MSRSGVLSTFRLALAVAGAAVWSLRAEAGDVQIKAAPASNDLSVGTNWIGNAAPSGGDRSVFDGALSTSEFVLGSDTAWQGIEVFNPGAGVTVDAGNVLTLGTGGIAMGAASQGLTMNCGMVLSADQVFNVGTQLSVGGTLSLGSHTLTVTGGGVTMLSGTPGLPLNGSVAGDPSARVVMSGSGTLTLGADSSLLGITVNSGRLNLVGKNLSQGTIMLGGGTLDYSTVSSFLENLQVTGSVTLLHTGQVSIAGGGNWTGSGTVTWQTAALELLSGQFDGFNGTLLFGSSAGSLRLTGNTDRNFGNAAVDLGTGTFTWLTRDGGNQSIGALSGGTATTLKGASTSASATNYFIGGANQSTTFAGVIVNNGANSTGLTKVGTGTLTLTGTASNYSGALTIANGVLATNQSVSLGTAATAITLGNSAAGTAGTLRWTGTGTLTSSRLLTLETTGTIEAIGGSGPIFFSSSGAVSYGTTVNMPRTLVLTGANGGVNSFGGRVSDNGSGKVMLVKSGTNTWQVTRTSGTYSGGTEIDGGTLIANGLSGQTPLGVGDVTVNSGGTLAGAMTIGGAGPALGQQLIVNGGGVLSPGNGVGAIGTMLVQYLTLRGGAGLTMNLQGDGSADAFLVLPGGTLNLTGSSAASPIGVSVFATDGVTGFAQSGTYSLFTGVDAVSSDGAGHLTNLLGATFAGDSLTSGVLTNFSVLNLPAGYSGMFSLANTGSASNIVLTIGSGPAGAVWTGSGVAGDWGDSGNWSGGVPGTARDSASFSAGSPGGTISLNGPRHVGALSLDAGTKSGYTLLAGGGGGKLFLDNGTAGASVTSVSGVNVIAADVALVSGATLAVTSGSLVISGVVSSTGAALAVPGPGVVVLAGYSGTGDLSVNGGRLAIASTGMPRQTPGVMLQMKSLTMAAGAVLDVTNHDAMIGHTTLSAVAGRIITGFGLGNPGGAAITSSTAVGSTFLVPLDADALLGNGSPGSAIGRVWDGVAITEPGTVILKYTYFGDVTLDGKVDGLDYATAVAHFGQSTPGFTDIGAAWLMGDMNFDGVVNGADFSKMAGNVGAQAMGAGGLEIGMPEIVSVPEPASLVLLGLGAIGLLKRRRSQSESARGEQFVFNRAG